MRVYEGQLLDPDKAEEIKQKLIDSEEWTDGRNTAGISASPQKINEQLDFESELYSDLSREIFKTMDRHRDLCSFIQPRGWSGPYFSKTVEGGKYGWHYDNVFMGNPPVRTDVSFTIALSDPEDYDGGYLQLKDGGWEVDFKLQKGEIVVYPAGLLHQVTPVKNGVRYVCCGWGNSLIRDAEIRHLLMDLFEVNQELYNVKGLQDSYMKLSNISNILTRRFSD